MFRRAIILVIALLVAAHLSAQEHPNLAKGAGANITDPFPEGDAVNLFNGNIVIAIPLGQSYPVNGGLSYTLTLYYNARPWEWRSRCDGGGCYTQTVPSDG